jgi:hypothetical protein
MKKVEDVQRKDTTIDDSDFCENSEEELQAIEEQIRQSQRSSEQVDCQTTRHRCEANPRGHNVRKGKARATESEVRAMYEHERAETPPLRVIWSSSNHVHQCASNQK